MNVALYYHPEAYAITGEKLMGRNAAGESFLRGYLAYGGATEFWAQVQDPDHGAVFAQTVRGAGRTEPVRIVQPIGLGALAEVGALYFPGPDIGESAWRRAAFGHAGWSLCGITHTTASAAAMDGIANLLTAPVQPWDALICTSTAVRDNVQILLQAQVDYLKSRFGLTKVVLPQAPIIPLGVHRADFQFEADRRAQARNEIGAGPDSLVVLYMGRLSPHAKAHPVAMYQALEKASAGRKIVLVECGWFANDSLRVAYERAAALCCPSIRVVRLDGRKPAARDTAWAGADVFCSLPDNIQETFGIVPIEALAAGLPMVVSDWNGYRDSVRDGIDGFRAPTVMAAPGGGADLALRHALGVDNYDFYIGHACSFVSVDVEAAAQAFIRLFDSAELRQRMGAAGRARSAGYDWAAIIPQYDALWARLAEIRKAAAGGVEAAPHVWPARMDPFHAFAGYPTRTLTPETRLALTEDVSAARRRLTELKTLAIVSFNAAVTPSDLEIDQILARAAAGPASALALIKDVEEPRRPFAYRGLVWLMKLGLLRISA